MHQFDYREKPKELLTAEIVSLISRIREHKGRQDLLLEAEVDELSNLLEVAKIQSTGASNRIEGIFTSDKRLTEIVQAKSEPRNRPEQEIAGYREVLQTIHENYEFIVPTPNVILQLHQELYSFSGNGGRFKTQDNQITEIDTEGNYKVRFQPVSAFDTKESMSQMSQKFLEAIDKDEIDSLVLISMYILDFLSIHPFNDGNGRMSRLLTLLLYYRSGFLVGKYISLELLIEKSKESYYESLQLSSVNWHESENDYKPFVQYYLSILLKAYNEFDKRVEHLQHGHLSKPDRIKAIIERTLGKITKNEIMEQAPDISKATVERTLIDLQQKGFIEKVGQGRASAYVKKRNNE